jgi:subtilase family serine protease
VDQHLADIVSNSYGFSTELLPTGYVKPINDTFIQAAAEGIGMYFSSGDAGDETHGSGDPAQATPDWPAVSPWVTAVGGTSLAVGAANDYLFETGWETGRAPLLPDNTWGAPVFTTGSGGGTSRLFAQPSYQAGVVPNALATAHGLRSQPMRVVPDVSMLGDPNTGFRVGQTQTFSDGAYYDEYRIGGTSLSSPLMAGVMALAQQRAGAPIGFANPALYALGAAALHDVVQPATTQAVARVDYINSQDASGGLRTTLRYLSYDQVLTIHSAPGYDDVTGRGTPTGTAFLAGMAGH